jgi:arsenate reductase
MMCHFNFDKIIISVSNDFFFAAINWNYYEQNILHRFWYLPKIIKSLPKGNNLVFRYKAKALTEEELEEMYLLSNIWSLVKAQLYKSMDLKQSLWLKPIIKKVYLEHYTFWPDRFYHRHNVYVGGTQQNMLQVMKALAMSKGMLRFGATIVSNLRHYIYHART